MHETTLNENQNYLYEAYFSEVGLGAPWDMGGGKGESFQKALTPPQHSKRGLF